MERVSVLDVSAGPSVSTLPGTPLARRAEFSLGSATVRPALLRVDGPAGVAVLEPKVMQVLVAFADVAGAVLTREDLMMVCWKGRTVGDDSVNRVIVALRKAARKADAGFWIENIPRTGYRLVETQLPADMAVRSPRGDAEAMRLSPDAEAEQLVVAARVALRPGLLQADRKAIILLERAVAISPYNANAWGLHALTLARLVESPPHEEAVPPAAVIDRVLDRALTLDNGNADALAAWAVAKPYFGDWLAAERRFAEVAAKHPDHVLLQTARAFLLASVGRLRESGLTHVKTFPLAPFEAESHCGLINGLWFLNRIAEADEAASQALACWPQHNRIWFARLWLLGSTNRCDIALHQIDEAVGRLALPPPLLKVLKTVFTASQTRDSAEIGSVAGKIVAVAKRSVAYVDTAMMLLNQLGAVEHAFDLAHFHYLQPATVTKSLYRRRTNFLFVPTAEAMRRDERFIPLMRQIGLAEYWEKRGICPDFLA